MGQAQYDIYQSNVLSLAQSITVKCAAVADAINTALMTEQGLFVDLADPTTWKYYLNLAGRYHPSDTPMTVISQDTLQTIDFTPANLALNTATALAYQVGSRYYNDLVSRYPTQTLLIRGILNPVDLMTAIQAADGTILWYNQELVESNEMSLILDLQTWIQNFFKRWHVPAYANVDDLYLAGMLGVMYMQIPSMVMQLRLKYCHTYQAHSYHITEYLGANGGLDQFASSLTKKQMLWLYRNIRYIQRNPGAQTTFQTLIEHILTERNLPLSAWTMQHDVSQTQTTLVPNPIFERSELNLSLSEGGVDVRTVQAMLTAELPLAKNNQADSQTVTETTAVLANANSDRLLTKVLESSVLDLTDATPYKLADCLLNHWLYFAAIGKYKAVVTVENPRTGDNYTLSAADAFVVYTYAFLAGRGLSATTIPALTANKVRKLIMPPPAEIRQYLTDAVDDNQLMAVYTNQPPLARSYISIESFNLAVNAIHQGELYHHALFSTQGHLWTRAEMEFATLYLWNDVPCDLGAGQNYSTWFASRNLDIPLLTQEQLLNLANTILATATGTNLSIVESLGDIQAAMLKIMGRLSSYSVQYLASINTSPITVLERPSIRLGDVTETASDNTYVTIPYADILDEEGTGKNTFDGVMISDVSIFDQHLSGEGVFDVDVMAEVVCRVPITIEEEILMPTVGLMSVTDNVSTDIPTTPVVDFSQYQLPNFKSLPTAFTGLNLGFYSLTDTDRASLETLYNNYIAANGLPVGSIDGSIVNTLLPPLYP